MQEGPVLESASSDDAVDDTAAIADYKPVLYNQRTEVDHLASRAIGIDLVGANLGADKVGCGCDRPPLGGPI